MSRPVRRRSLRVRLMLLVAGVFAVTLLGAGLAARSQFRAMLEDNARRNGLLLLDDFIAPSAPGVPIIDEAEVTRVVYLNADGDEIAGDEIDRLITEAFDAAVPTELVDMPIDALVGVAVNGPVIAGDVVPAELTDEQIAELEADGVFADAFAVEIFTPSGPAEPVDLGDGSIAVGRPVGIGDETLTIAVAAPGRSIGDAVAAATLVGALAIPLLTLLVAACTWLVAARTLRPVEAIRRQVDETDPARLDRHVPVSGSGDEIDRLAGTMNEMLDRLHSASQQHRRFISDASHELRSPITATLATIDTTPTDEIGDRWPDVAATIATEQRRLERLVDDLLLLAELDERRNEPLTTESVDLDELVLDEVARPRSLPVHAHIEHPWRIAGNGRLLGRALSNLVDNAAHHGTSRVDVTLTADSHDPSIAILRVDDDGPGVPAPDRARIVDRFARLDEARRRPDGGAGLGLAIASEVADRHGAELRIGASASGGARFELMCPDR